MGTKLRTVQSFGLRGLGAGAPGSPTRGTFRPQNWAPPLEPPDPAPLPPPAIPAIENVPIFQWGNQPAPTQGYLPVVSTPTAASVPPQQQQIVVSVPPNPTPEQIAAQQASDAATNAQKQAMIAAAIAAAAGATAPPVVPPTNPIPFGLPGSDSDPHNRYGMGLPAVSPVVLPSEAPRLLIPPTAPPPSSFVAQNWAPINPAGQITPASLDVNQGQLKTQPAMKGPEQIVALRPPDVTADRSTSVAPAVGLPWGKIGLGVALLGALGFVASHKR